MPEQEPQASTTPTNETATAAPDPETTAPASDPAPGDTVGTGSVIALGCIGGTVFLIVLGLVYLLLAQVFG